MTLPRTGLGTTSLGAVGGARGSAAGAIRILVEFLTQYDSAAVKQLESDLNSLASQEAVASTQALGAQNGLAKATKQRAAAEADLKRLIALRDNPAATRREVKRLQDIGVATKLGKEQIAASIRDKIITDDIAKTMARITNEKKQQARFTTQLQRAGERARITDRERLQTEQQLTQLQSLRQQLPARLGGLALGAVGGIFGGALVGVGFAAADALLKQVESRLNDLLDPGRKARDAIKEVGAAIESLSENGDRIKGVEEFLLGLGIAADQQTKDLLAEAAALDAGNKALQARSQITALVNGLESERDKIIRDRVDQLIKEQFHVNAISDSLRARVNQTGDAARFAAQAERELEAAELGAAHAAAAAAAEAGKLEAARRQQAAAAQLAAFAEEQMVAAVTRAAGLKTAGFDAAIEGAQSTGPSRRTRALEAQIERLQNAPSGDAGKARQQELANIAEERALILLRQRLRLLGTNIDLEKFSGKFLLEAIHAKQKALEKEAAAQDRLNRLLDLQFKMSQRLQRNEGESITDFFERRAQENRGFLEEQRDIEREKTEERLQELEDKTQDEVALQELAERRKNAAVKQGTDNRIRNLQKELEASRKADAAAVDAKIKALRKQKEAYEQSAKDAEHFATIAANAQIREAIRGVQKVTDLAKLSGQISGLTAAKNFLSSLLGSGVLNPREAADIRGALDRINTTLDTYVKKSLSLRPPGRTIFKAGGLIPLNNASTPFGSNVRFGEEGTEYGLIFQQKVAQGMAKGMKSTGDMTFYLQKGDDWMRDRYEMRKLVKEAVSEALK